MADILPENIDNADEESILVSPGKPKTSAAARSMGKSQPAKSSQPKHKQDANRLRDSVLQHVKPAKRKRGFEKANAKAAKPNKRIKTAPATSHKEQSQGLPSDSANDRRSNLIVTSTPAEDESANASIQPPAHPSVPSDINSVPNPTFGSNEEASQHSQGEAVGNAAIETTSTEDPISDLTMKPDHQAIAQNQGGLDQDSRGSSPLSSPPSTPRLEAVPSMTVPAEKIDKQELIRDDALKNVVPVDRMANTFRAQEIVVAQSGSDAGQLSSDVATSKNNDSSADSVREPATSIINMARKMLDLQTQSVPQKEDTAEAKSKNMVEEDSTLEAPSTPDTRAPIQLPTPPSSIDTNAGMEVLTSLRSSRRNTKQPTRLGDPVDTTTSVEALGEDLESESMPGYEDSVDAEERVKKAAPSGNKTKQSGTRKPKTTLEHRSKNVSIPEPAAKKRKTTGKSHEAILKPSLSSSKTPNTKLNGSKIKKVERPAKQAATAKGRISQTSAVPKAVKSQAKKPQEGLVVRLPRPINKEKLELSRKLTRRLNPPTWKPDPQGKPEVWAESRQALCETLPYFKKPQGGCYQNDGHVYGFLFDGVGHCCEYLDENVIICRAGGSMESDASGMVFQKKDQSMKEAQVVGVLNDIVHHNPVIVICGNRNTAAPTKMPHQYCVLGWHKPVLVWAEKTAGKGPKVWVTIKYRLERLNRRRETWYAPKDHQVSDQDKATAGDLEWKTCDSCKQEFPQVYLQDWMCLNSGCRLFWKIDGKDAPYGSEGLDYDPAFLLYQHRSWKGENEVDELEPASLRPSVPNVGNIIGDNLAYINTRGICCPRCGRCNSRRKFKGWECENPGCGFRLFPEHRPVVPTMLHTPWDAAPTLVRNRYDGAQVFVEIKEISGFKVSIYTFRGIDGYCIEGSFIHMAATKSFNSEAHGPNEMFEAIQTVDMSLERRAFAVKKMSDTKTDKETVTLSQPVAKENGQEDIGTSDLTQEPVEQDEAVEPPMNQGFQDGDLMTAFSMNYGMPYKFVASGASQSFDNAPWPVTECRRRLNWAQRALLPEDGYVDFNEELVFSYLEGQKIEYHDDGEQGLGPRIATLSLGGRAKMHLRMKGKHYVGCSKTGLFTEERPMPGSIDGDGIYQKRLYEWEMLQQINDDGPAYTKRRKEIPKELGLFEKRTKKADDLVTVTLNHGDIAIMDGFPVQQYLEHKVVPEGYLRFALTCRTVLEDHLRPEERLEYMVMEDKEMYMGPLAQMAGN